MAGLQIPHYLKHKSTMTVHTIQGFQKKDDKQKKVVKYLLGGNFEGCFPTIMIRKGPVGGVGTLRLFVDGGSPPVPSPSKTRSHQVPNPRPRLPRPVPNSSKEGPDFHQQSNFSFKHFNYLELVARDPPFSHSQSTKCSQFSNWFCGQN